MFSFLSPFQQESRISLSVQTLEEMIRGTGKQRELKTFLCKDITLTLLVVKVIVVFTDCKLMCWFIDRRSPYFIAQGSGSTCSQMTRTQGATLLGKLRQIPHYPLQSSLSLWMWRAPFRKHIFTDRIEPYPFLNIRRGQDSKLFELSKGPRELE